ncbi:hypothetical protein JCM6882_002048 [Rhodosporidiobolus microsporus]
MGSPPPRHHPHHSSFSPITRLPAEILLSIFHHARSTHLSLVPSYSASPAAHSLARRLNPVLAVSHTCRAWRALADGAPELWSVVHLDGDIEGEEAEGKVGFWVEKARRRRRGGGTGEPADEEDDAEREGENAVDTLVLINVQDWTDDTFSYLCEALELVHRLRLRRVHASWRSVNSTANEHRQLQSLFTLLLSFARTLTHLTLHTTSHLRILFSLPRLGHTFTALSALEIRAAPISVPASDAYLVPSFLPRYGGEEDWNPLSSLRSLVLVGPIWRLRYRDGTVASPTLDAADVPALRYAELSSSSPQVHWSLLSSPLIKHLHLRSWFDHPHLPDPDLALHPNSGGIANLTSLSLSRSPQLATRLLDLALSTPGLRWANLEALDLRGAVLTQAQLDLFSEERAPRLVELDLSDSTASPSGTLTLTLPTFTPSLRLLSLLHIRWLTPHELVQAVVHRGVAVGLEELCWDADMAEGEERALRAVGVRVVGEEEE